MQLLLIRFLHALESRLSAITVTQIQTFFQRETKMKKLKIIFIIFAAGLSAAQARAVLALSVDLGTAAGEAGYTLNNWGPVEPTTHPGGWGGIAGDPASYDKLCRTLWGYVENTRDASITFPTQIVSATVRHLDGLSNDSFRVEVDGNLWGSYSAVSGVGEFWTVSSFSGTPGTILTITCTGPAGQYFNPYGQVGIDRIEAIPISEPVTYYVDASVSPGGDGSSWMKAFNRLSDALAVAKAGDEIRVAEGIYKPVSYIPPPPPPPPPPPMGGSNAEEPVATAEDRTATFNLVNGVAIRGGYAGFGEPDPGERDPNKYETILSGDIGIAGYEWDNCYHVISSGWLDATTVLDGLTITAGNANEQYPSSNSYGGGMYNYSGSPTLVNCTFTGNFAAGEGGGMFNGGQSNPTLTGCTFRGNLSIYEGGAISNRTSSPTITNCSFIENSSNHGGGISIWPGSPIVSDCTFSSNSAELGGAVFSYDSSSTLNNCIFNNNYAEEWGGAICNLSSIVPLVQDNSGSPGGETNIAKSIPLFADYTFSDNSSGYERSINSESDSSTLADCTFSGNSAMAGGGVCYIGESNPSLDNCTFSGNSALIGGGFVSSQCTAILTDCTFRGNSGEQGGAFYSEVSSAVLVNCIFRANTSSYAGAAINEAISSSSLYNCLFNGNTSNLYGGAMYYWYESSPQMFNCTFAGNSALIGNAIVCAVPEGFYPPPPPSFVRAFNCIFWDGGNEIANRDNSIITVTYSDVKGGYSGTGNITADPCFVEPEYFGPVSYWKFDEAEGTTAYDSTGFNHGTIYGAQWTSGQVSSALDFDGMNDYVDIPYDSSLDIDASEGISLSLWIKLNSYPDSLNQGPIFGLYVSTGIGTKNYLSIMKSGYGNVIAWDQWPKTSYGWIESIKPDLDTWYHVVVVEDSSYRAIHINGSLDASDNTPESYEGNPPDTIRIGSRADAYAPFYFHGKIDEVAIYDRVLSADEIQQLYESPDYRLQPDSPCINAGDPDYIPEPNETDLDGNPRVIGGRIDMGAYELQNTTPFADAGPDQVAECACNTAEPTMVTLDGSGSYDADGDPLTFTWTGPFVGSPANGATPTVTLEAGCPDDYVITLVVNDGTEDSEPNEVVITVVDTTPPEFEFSVTPTMLWPPDHKMVLITPSWTVSDDCAPSPNVSLISIVANEGDNTIGDGHTSNDIQIGEDGSIYLRSERSGTGTDRLYTITYQAVDDCGNTTLRSATVSIPHDFKVLARIASRWLWAGPAGRIPEDLNGDGVVNLMDIAIFSNNWIQ